MAEDITSTQNQGTQTSAPEANTQSTTQPPAQSAGLTAEELSAIERDLEAASSKLVSDDVAQKIAAAKAETRKEAEKEFATNQKIKEMEAQLLKEKQEREELQKQSAETLEQMKEKLNAAISSQAVSTAKNPFDSPQQGAPNPKNDTYGYIDNMTDEDMASVEKESFFALMNRGRE